MPSSVNPDVCIPPERARAARTGAVEVDSHRLERTVRAAATASLDEGEFVRRLRRGGVLIRPRFAAGRDDVVAGYSIAVRPATGDKPIWFGGGRLARDLTLPRLREGWPESPKAAQGPSMNGGPRLRTRGSTVWSHQDGKRARQTHNCGSNTPMSLPSCVNSCATFR